MGEVQVHLTHATGVTSGTGTLQTTPPIFPVDFTNINVPVTFDSGFSDIHGATPAIRFNSVDIRVPDHTFTDLIFRASLATLPMNMGNGRITIDALSGTKLEGGTTFNVSSNANHEFTLVSTVPLTEVDLSSPTGGGFLRVRQFEISGAALIPEPSTWAMMILGFAGLGFLGYRQTRRAKPQAAWEISVIR
jgi:hypothetical protein